MAEPIVPRSERTDPAQTLVIEVPQEKPARRRRRWMGWLIAGVIVVILLLVAFFVGDALARQYATGLVREKIVAALELDPQSEVDVNLGDGSILLQAATGSIDEISVHIPEFTLGDVVGEAEITATGVPIDTSKPLETMGIEVTVDEANVKKLSGYLSGVDLTSIDLRDGLIRIGSSLDVFFASIPVSIDLSPSATDGGISFEPVTVLLGDQQLSVADLRAIPGISGIVGNLLGSQTVCVASYLPVGLTVDDVNIVGTDLIVSINGDGVVLDGPDLSARGTCPPS
ncbi:MAG: LmeA family phospholipid-binding protein [Rhodoglobus sp.]